MAQLTGGGFHILSQAAPNIQISRLTDETGDNSGVAYCDDQRGAEGASAIQLVTSWPGQGQGNNEKVPSRIIYDVPSKDDIQWGNQIRPNTKGKVHTLMKLSLDEHQKKSKQLKLLLAFLSSSLGGLNLSDSDSEDEDGPPDYPGRGPVDIVGDYLTEVRKHVWGELTRRYGETIFSNLTKELVVTVPAVWSERAKDLTLKAVTKAKFDTEKISLVTEPEAAAIYTLKGMTEGANREEVKVCVILPTDSYYWLLTLAPIRSEITSYCVTRVVVQSTLSPTRSRKYLQSSRSKKLRWGAETSAALLTLTRYPRRHYAPNASC